MHEPPQRLGMMRKLGGLAETSNIIALVALLVSLITAYYTLLPTTKVTALRTSEVIELDDDAFALKITHLIHNAGNQNFAFFGAYQYQTTLEELSDARQGCARQFGEDTSIDRQQFGLNGLGVAGVFGSEPAIIGPGETKSFTSVIRTPLSTAAEDGSDFQFLAFCSTPQIWVPGYGMTFLEHAIPILASSSTGSASRSFVSAQVSALDRLLGNGRNESFDSPKVPSFD